MKPLSESIDDSAREKGDAYVKPATQIAIMLAVFVFLVLLGLGVIYLGDAPTRMIFGG